MVVIVGLAFFIQVLYLVYVMERVSTEAENIGVMPHALRQHPGNQIEKTISSEPDEWCRIVDLTIPERNSSTNNGSASSYVDRALQSCQRAGHSVAGGGVSNII